ncbi:MAG: hypothetical protein HC888_10365 [Candidatus Competibacteraceae bacterium]|nr:hypothetical protein [Candidatus Competibacteraceae bacterium]
MAQNDITVFLRPWSKMIFVTDNLDASSDQRLLTVSQARNLRKVAEACPLFRPTVDFLLSQSEPIPDDRFFLALVKRKMDADQTVLDRRLQLLPDFLEESRMPSTVKRIAKKKNEESRIAGSSGGNTTKYGPVLDPPGLRLLLSKRAWDSIGESLRKSLASEGVKVVAVNKLLVPQSFIDEKEAVRAKSKLGPDARLVTKESSQRSIHTPNLDIQKGKSPFLAKRLMAAPPGTTYVSNEDMPIEVRYTEIRPKLLYCRARVCLSGYRASKLEISLGFGLDSSIAQIAS